MSELPFGPHGLSGGLSLPTTHILAGNSFDLWTKVLNKPEGFANRFIPPAPVGLLTGEQKTAQDGYAHFIMNSLTCKDSLFLLKNS